MDIRDAADTDAEALAAAADTPIRAIRRLIRDRTVRLAIAETSSDPRADAPADDEPVLGLVGFDVCDGVLHVTRLGGTEAAMRRLLEEPLRFTSVEDLPVEVFVLGSEAPLCEAIEHVDFDRVGHGPWSEGSPTLRYILDETEQSSLAVGENRRREYIPPACQVVHDRATRETAAGSETAVTTVEELFVSLAGSNPVMQSLFGGVVIAGMNTLGVLLVLVWRDPSKRSLDTLLGFVAGVMLAASFTSLILPGIETAGGNPIPVLVGFVIGIIALDQVDLWIPHVHILVTGKTRVDAPETDKKMASVVLFIVTITIHNMPEGLAVGVGLGSGDLGTAVPLMLATGIQSIPEELAVSIVTVNAGLRNTTYVTLAGTHAGLVEIPLTVSGAWAIQYAAALLPYAMSFAADAMLLVISDEIIPETHSNGHERVATFGTMVGVVAMLYLDVTLG